MDPRAATPARIRRERASGCEARAAPPGGRAILTRTDTSAIPPASRLESTALHLEAQGDLRALICFVERWREVAEPTTAARLAQARALVGLGLMDRAWSRLQELLESKSTGVQAVAVTARMFLERGWTKQARHALQGALADYPDNTELQALWERAAEPPTQPDLEAADLDSADPKALLTAAEHHMALGSFVKARSLLERARKDAPTNKRVLDLLWALEGDFDLVGISLAELTDRYGPDLSALADLSDDAEHTAEVDAAPRMSERELSEGNSSFAGLFRDLEPRTELYQGHDDAEITQLSSLAALDELRQSEQQPPSLGGSDDTQILRVVHRNAPPPPANDKPDGGTFDLGAFRREMGMQYAPSADYAEPPEEEDDDLIFHTRREETQEVTETTTAVSGLDLQPEESKLPENRRALVDEDAAWVRTAEEPVPEPAPPVVEERPPARAAQANAAWPWGLAAFGSLLMIAGGFVALAILAQVLKSLAG